MAKKICAFIAILCAMLAFSSQEAEAQWMDRVSTIPKHRAKNVPLDQVIVLRFRNRVNPTVDGNGGVLYELQSKKAVKTTIGYSDDFRTVTITPAEPLKRNTFYSVSFNGLLSSVERKNMYDGDLQFTTIGGNFRCLAYTFPSEATLPPGGFMDVVYNFKESGGGLGEVKRCTLVYETENGQEISRSSDDMRLILKDMETVKFPSTISVPRNIGEQMKGSKIFIRRLFEGVDSEGNFFTIRTGIKTLIADRQASAAVSEGTSYRASVSDPDPGAVIPKGSLIPAQCSISGIPGQQVHGCWVINGVPGGFFSEIIPQSGKLKKTFSDRAMASKDGINSLAVQIISPEKYLSETCEYIVSSSPIDSPVIIAPKNSQIFRKNISKAPTFVWANANGALSYKITISKDKTPDSSAKWTDVEINRYTPNWINWGNLGSGVFYWSVKAVFPGGKESNPVTGTFMISDGEK